MCRRWADDVGLSPHRESGHCTILRDIAAGYWRIPHRAATSPRESCCPSPEPEASLIREPQDKG